MTDMLDQSEFTLLYGLCNVHTETIGDIILLWKSVKAKKQWALKTLFLFFCYAVGSNVVWSDCPPLLSTEKYLDIHVLLRMDCSNFGHIKMLTWWWHEMKSQITKYLQNLTEIITPKV